MNHIPTPPRPAPCSKLKHIFRLAFLSCALAGVVHGQTTYTWNGGSSTTGNWSDGNNWGGTGPSTPQGYLNFPGATRNSSTNDFANGGAGFQIYFKTGANAFNLYGNSIIFYDFGGVDPNIQNEGGFTNQTINFAITNGNTHLSGSVGILNINLNTTTAQGPLTFNGPFSSASSANARVINVSGSNTVTFNGVISDFPGGGGTMALTQLGTGTTVLTTTNTFTGATTINSGIVQLGDGATKNGVIAGNITDNSVLTFADPNPQTYAGAITGTGSLIKTAAGTLILSSSNSFSGGTTLSNGVIQVNNAAALGTGNVTANTGSSNGKIYLNGVIITNNITMVTANSGASQSVIQEVDATSSTNYGIVTINTNAFSGGHIYGPITSGLLTMAGAINLVSPANDLLVRDGFLRFSGGGSYTNMDIRSRTSSLGANNGLSTTAIVDIGGNGSTSLATMLDLNGFNQTLAGVKNSVSLANVAWVSNSVSTTQSTLTLTVSNIQTFSGSIVGNLAVNVTGGTQVYSNSAVIGNGVFGYTGDTTISGGTLKVAAASLLPNGSTKGNMIVNSPGVLDVNTFSQTINSLSGNGTVDTVAGGTPSLTVGNANINSTFSGLIKNTAGALTLTVTNPSTILTLSGANNTFSGGVNIGNGAANFRSGVIRAAATQTLGTGAVIVGNGGNESTGRLELSNNISLNNYINLPERSSVAASIENLNGNNTNSGTLGLTSGGGFALVQSDAGTLTLGTSGGIAVSNQVTGGTRIITLTGAGNGTVAGNIIDVGTAAMAVTKDGAGTWTLSGADTYSGDTRITNGTLLINNTLALQNSSVDMNPNDSGTLNLNNLNATLGGLKNTRSLALGTGTISVGNNGVATVYSGSLSGNALTKIGTGALTLSGTNVHTGVTTISAGELIGQTGGSLSNSTVSVSAGATNGVLLAVTNGQWVCGGLTFSSGTTYADFNFNGIALSTNTAPVLVNGGLTFTVTPSVIVRSAGSIITPGQYPLIKYTGSLAGSPPSTVLSLPAGLTATISNNTANSSIDLVVTVGNQVKWFGNNPVWDINTTASWTNNVSGPVVNYLDGEAVLFDDTASGSSPVAVALSTLVTPLSITANLTNKNYTISSNAINATFVGSGPLIKNGSGTLTVSTTNTAYAGNVTVNGGTLALGNAANIGTGTITLNNGTTFLLNSAGTTFPANPVFVPAGASANVSGSTALGNGIGGTISSGDNTSVLTVISTVSFSAITRQFDPFLGTVTVNASQTMRFSGTSGTDGSTNATFNVLGTLQARNAGQTWTLGALSGSGTIGPNQSVAGTGTTTYQVGTNNASTTFSGKFMDYGGLGVTNAAVLKMGFGTFTVSGNSPHSGPTTVGSGALIGVTGGSFSNSTVTVNTGATNGVNVTVAGGQWTCTNLTYNAGTTYAVFAFGANTPSATIAPLVVQNNLTFGSTPNIIITGGSTTIPVGTYPLIKYTNTLSGTPPAVPYSMPQYVSGIITNDTANKLVALIVTNVVVPPPLVWSTGTSNWDFASINWTNAFAGSNVVWSDANAAQFDDSAAGTGPFTVTLNTNVNPSGVTFSNNLNSYTLAGTGSITGTGSLTKKGTGTLVLANTNTYNGGTIVIAGTLQGSSATLLGSINNNASLVFDQSISGSNNAVITGTGTVTKQNTGLVAVGGNNSYTGKTFINAGTLAISAGPNLGGTPASATADQITINGGTLQATNGAATITLPGNAGITVGASGATIDVASGITLDYPAQGISGTGALAKNGAGTFEIDEGTATSTYTSLTLNAGIIAFNKSSGGLGAGSLTINGGLIRTTTTSARTPNNSSVLVNGDFTLGSSTTAAISFSGGGAWTLANGNRNFNVDTITATITGVIGDGGNGYQLIKSGSGTLALGNAGTFSGGISMTAGNLNLGNNAAAGTGSTISYSGGSVQVGSGITITNKFDNSSSGTSDLMMDCPAGTGIWAGPVTSSGSGGFRPGTSGGTLVFTGTGTLSSRNLIVPHGTVVFATNANFSSTGGANAFGRSAAGSASVTVQNNAILSSGTFSLGGGLATPGPIILTIQDSASVSSGTANVDLHNSTATTATTAVNLNGGTLSVGGFIKSQTGGSQTSALSFNGGTLKAAQNNVSFLPALAGLSAIISTNGGTLNDSGFNITIAQPLTHDSTLGTTADGGLTKSGAGITTLSGVNTYTGPTIVSGGALLLTGALGTNTVTINSTLSGTGTVNGATTISLGGTLQAGLGGNDTSALTISNSLVLGGNVQFNLNRTNTQTANTIAGLTSASYGGTLTVTNVGGSLTNGDTFLLFSAVTYAGGFTNIILPALDPSLLWNTNNLAINGRISVVPAISPSSLMLGSSENPSGYLDTLAFTATVTPTNATGSVTFFNGATPLSTNGLVAGVAGSASLNTLLRGTNTITAIYSGDVNYLPSTNSLAQVVTNHPPVAGNVGYYRGPVNSFKIKLSDLLTNATDVDGDTLTVSGFGTSTNGITPATGGGFGLYSNSSLVNDQFTYTVSDGFGGTATGTITLTSQAFLTGQNASVSVGGSTATVSFAGIPGYSYSVQRSTNLVDWSSIWTTNAPANGVFNYIDGFSDIGVVPASAYYRLEYNP